MSGGGGGELQVQAAPEKNDEIVYPAYQVGGIDAPLQGQLPQRLTAGHRGFCQTDQAHGVSEEKPVHVPPGEVQMGHADTFFVEKEQCGKPDQEKLP